MEEESWRWNHDGRNGGRIMGSIWEASGKHFGSHLETIWVAFGRSQAEGALKRHLEVRS